MKKNLRTSFDIKKTDPHNPPVSPEKLRFSLLPGQNLPNLRISLDPRFDMRLSTQQNESSHLFRHSIDQQGNQFIPIYVERETERENKINGLKNALN